MKNSRLELCNRIRMEAEHTEDTGFPLDTFPQAVQSVILDMTKYEKCACGRTAVRMGRILGRSDDMLIIRGVNVFPSQVESVILELPEFEAHYLIVVDRMNNTDTFQIQVEVRQEYSSDGMNKMIALKKKIAARMQSVIGLQPDIKIVEPRSIERSMGKAKHVIDKRKLV